VDDNTIRQHFQQLNDLNAEDAFQLKKPLLAHYTTIQVLEKILATGELWFSSPLYMNDLEEVRFGIFEGQKLIMESKEIDDACSSKERTNYFRHCFNHHISHYDMHHLRDTYVFCTSEHRPTDNDGLLSMWRGYGANGNGVAIVFDAGQLEVLKTSPLIIANVIYKSTEGRLQWLKDILSTFVGILKATNIPTEKLHIASECLFERIKIFALFTKHSGFDEEEEWRVVYMPERDPNNNLASMRNYSICPRGVEPKLRFKVAPLEGIASPNLSLSGIIERIILGPTISSPMARTTVLRMFDLLGREELAPKLRASTIPFQHTSEAR
jgi:hypothetical protein